MIDSNPSLGYVMEGLNLNLNAFGENATRLGNIIQERIQEHAREIHLTRGIVPTSLDVTDDKIRNIRKQLDSKSSRDRVDSLKALIAVCFRSCYSSFSAI